MASIAGDLTKEIVPLAALGLGVIVLIRNPAIVGGLISWVDNLTKGLGGGGGGGNSSPTGGGDAPKVTVNYNTPGQVAGGEMWNTFSMMPGGDPFKALLAAAFGTTMVNMLGAGKGGGSPTPNADDGKQTPNTPAFKTGGTTTVSPWTNQQAISWIQQQNRIYGPGGFLLTQKGQEERLKNYLAR